MPPHLAGMNFNSGKMPPGFNPSAMNERILAGGVDKSGLHVDQQHGHPNGPPFSTLPFFLPSLNGNNTLQNMAAAAAAAAAASGSDRGSHCGSAVSAEPPVSGGKQQRGEGGNSANRNSKLIF